MSDCRSIGVEGETRTRERSRSHLPQHSGEDNFSVNIHGPSIEMDQWYVEVQCRQHVYLCFSVTVEQDQQMAFSDEIDMILLRTCVLEPAARSAACTL